MSLRAFEATWASVLIALSLAGIPACSAFTGDATDCSARACANPVDLSAEVPPIGSSVWTVDVCKNATCIFAEIKLGNLSPPTTGLQGI